MLRRGVAYSRFHGREKCGVGGVGGRDVALDSGSWSS